MDQGESNSSTTPLEFSSLIEQAALLSVEEYLNEPTATTAHFAILVTKAAIQHLHVAKKNVDEKSNDEQRQEPTEDTIKAGRSLRRRSSATSTKNSTRSSNSVERVSSAAGSDAINETIMDSQFENPFAPIIVSPLRIEFTEPELSAVSAATSIDGGGDEVIVTGYVQIKRKDMRTLRESQWLNDEIINMVSNLVKKFLEKPDKERVPKIYLPLTFFTSKLMSDKLNKFNFDNVKRWTTRAKVDVFACDFLIFPRNITNTHWACVFVDMKRKIVWNLDSLGRSDPTFGNIILRWLRHEHSDKKKSLLLTSDWKILGPPEKLPQQNNSSDCGMFLCLYVYYLAHGKIPCTDDFDQNQMSMFRKMVALWIIKQEIS